MRRSSAPSRVFSKQNEDEEKPKPLGKRKRNVDPEEEERKAQEAERMAKMAAISAEGGLEVYVKKVLSKPFKVPIAGYESRPIKKLGMTREQAKGPLHSPDEEGALVLYTPPDADSALAALSKKEEQLFHVVVDPVLGKVLRPHQREGVKFMYECLMGFKIPEAFGCIMADEMGLGKTLQCITLMWTLLKQGPDGKPTVNNCIIACPSSLVKNWYGELGKWLGNRISPLAIDGGTKQQIEDSLKAFIDPSPGLRNRLMGNHSVLIISYETLRLYSHILQSKPVGMILCDEGHRLKNSQSQTFQALDQLKTKRRIILSGTPIQNDLTEYFSLLNFVNPGLLGTSAEFRRKFELPILRARDSMASDKEIQEGNEKLSELLKLANAFIIRRTASILSKYLPVKVDLVVFCKMSEAQKTMYKNFLSSKTAKNASKSFAAGALAGITTLKKLANHPVLVYDKIEKNEDGFEDAKKLLPKGFNPKSYRPEEFYRPELSGKFMLLDSMLTNIRKNTNDKIVLISNYTQTLELFEQMCKVRKYGYVKLDGSLSINKRMKLVSEFNDPKSPLFCFLLSSKAGGCGLNLIGANRLVLFDPDWNPANDGQAMARVWRDGQKKTCFVYRFVTTGTIEEKIFQRQAHKQALSSCIVDEEQDVERHFSGEFLKDLFTYKEDTPSDTHDSFKCRKCGSKGSLLKIRNFTVNDSGDMSKWDHFLGGDKVPDDMLRNASVSSGDIVSFVFANQSHESKMGDGGNPPPLKKEKIKEDTEDVETQSTESAEEEEE